MNTVNINTIKSIELDIITGKRSLKNIAAECKIFEVQANSDEAKAVYARLSDCKTRKEFSSVFSSL